MPFTCCSSNRTTITLVERSKIMPKHLLRDLDYLKKEILAVGALVEEAIHKATTALIERRPELAAEVVEGDNTIDEREVHVEEECLKALALHQPVATDLRFIITVLKVNNDLERMGDLAANIAARAKALAASDPLPVSAEFGDMVEHVRSMVRQSLDALVNLDVALARAVYVADDVVDKIHRRMFKTVQEQMKTAPDIVERGTHLLSVSRHLERIADLATNIAEDVEFMVEGEIIRHRDPEDLD